MPRRNRRDKKRRPAATQAGAAAAAETAITVTADLEAVGLFKTKIVATRQLRDGRRAVLHRCPRCGQRCWTIGAEPSGCPCPTERGGDR